MTPDRPSLATTPGFRLRCPSIFPELMPLSRIVRALDMVTTSKNSRPGLPLRPRPSNSASALSCNLRLASSEARVGFVDGDGYRGPVSRGASGVRSGPAVDEFENVGVGLTIPIWCNRSANPAGLASGFMESDIMSAEAAGVSLLDPQGDSK